MRTKILVKGADNDENEPNEDLAVARFVRNKYSNQARGKRNVKLDKKGMKWSIVLECMEASMTDFWSLLN